MQINPAGGSSQDQHQRSSPSGLPSKREAESEREPTPAFCALFLCGGCFGERALDTRPKRRRIGVIAHPLRGGAKRFPCAQLFSAGGAVHAVRFKCSPFYWSAILKNSIAVFTCNIHRRSPCPCGAIAARRLKHLAKISLCLKK